MLEEKIRTRRARVGIVGLGYVGLPLAVEYAKAGFSVTGVPPQAAPCRSGRATAKSEIIPKCARMRGDLIP